MKGKQVLKNIFQNKSPRVKWIILLVLLLCVLIAVLVRCTGGAASDAEVRKGVAYLKKIDSSKAVKETEAKVKESRTDAFAKLIADASEEGSDSSFDPWAYFTDSVIMGDSRAVGFSVYEFLPESRVLAAGGNTIQKIDDSLKKLQNLNPSYIFLCYGLNDVTSARWTSADDWVKDFGSEIKKLQEMFPEATILVNSILPTTDAALSTSQRVKLIPDYEAAIKEYCSKNDIPFIDCTELVESHGDFQDVDGIHYKKDFYPYWAAEMIMEAYMGGDDSSDESTESESSSDESSSNENSSEDSTSSEE